MGLGDRWEGLRVGYPVGRGEGVRRIACGGVELGRELMMAYTSWRLDRDSIGWMGICYLHGGIASVIMHDISEFSQL